MIIKRRYAQKLKQWGKSFTSPQALINLLVVAMLLLPGFFHNKTSPPLRWYQEAYKDDDWNIRDNDTLERYQKILDSAKQREIHAKKIEEGDVVENGLNAFLEMGFIQYYKKPASDVFPRFVDSAQGHFITLGPYYLDNGSYFIPNKQQGFFKYVVYENDEKKEDPYDSFVKGHYAKIPVVIRFYDNKVLVLIGEKTSKIISLINNIFSVIFIVAGIIIFVAMPLDTLKSISKGRAFEKANVRDLSIIGWALITIPAFLMIKQWLLALIFHKYLVPQLHFDYRSFYGDNVIILLCGIIVLTIAKAFKKGYKLQQEQDLII